MEAQVFDFFKTFADITRMRMAALLSEEALTVEEMAARLHIKASDIPRQLAILEQINLLFRDGERYRLNERAFEALTRAVWSEHRPAASLPSNDVDADDFDRKVVRNFMLPDGKLREIPNQGKKRLAVLRHILQAFEPGKRYTEKEVNETLKRYYPDAASLRRYLYDDGLLKREQNGSAYWREEKQEA